VYLADTTPGATIYYTTNGTVPTTSSKKYTGSFIITAASAVRAFAVAGGSSSSPIVTTVYVILPPTLAPSFSPPPGSYSTPQTVTMADPAPGAAIYYTTNGSTPTTSSTRYTGPISVSSTEVIRAFALAGGYSSSPIVTNVYMFLPPAPSFSVAGGTYRAPRAR
jgi:hypothetical protein